MLFCVLKDLSPKKKFILKIYLLFYFSNLSSLPFFFASPISLNLHPKSSSMASASSPPRKPSVPRPSSPPLLATTLLDGKLVFIFNKLHISYNIRKLYTYNPIVWKPHNIIHNNWFNSYSTHSLNIWNFKLESILKNFPILDSWKLRETNVLLN